MRTSGFRFGVFEVDLKAGGLRKNGLRIRLQDQPFQILLSLLERPGEVVAREDLRQKLWPADTFVDFDHSLNAAINKLREALGDSASSPRFIETLPRRGYRFIAPVEPLGEAVPSSDAGTQHAAAATSPSEHEAGAPRPTPAPGPNLSQVQRSQRWQRVALLTSGLLVVFIAITVFLWLRSPQTPPSARAVTRFSINLPPGETFGVGGTDLDLSPDGKQIVYAPAMGEEGRTHDRSKLYLRSLDKLQIHALAGTEGGRQGAFPVFSPDGNGSLMLPILIRP